MWRDLRRFLRRWRGARRIEPRRRQLVGEIRAGLGREIRLATAGARGRDSIYTVLCDGQPVAMARLVNPHLRRKPVPETMPFRVLDGEQRIQREWVSYGAGAELALTPTPLWHCDDALVCRFVPGASLASRLERAPEQFWILNTLAAQALMRLHALGVSHMDASLANILQTPAGQLTFIDFEYGPAPGLDLPQQFAYDHLRLIESAIKTVPPATMLDCGPWVAGLSEGLSAEIKGADLAPLAPALPRLLGAAPLRAALAPVFTRLPKQA